MDKKMLTVLVRGLAASPGIAHGKAIYIKNLDELTRVKDGDVMVTGHDEPRHGAGHEEGLRRRHRRGRPHLPRGHRERASSASPASSAPRRAADVIKEGMEVTVDATRGVVYKGNVNLSSDSDKQSPAAEVAGDTARSAA
jgi:pyruvate,water dikinase